MREYNVCMRVLPASAYPKHCFIKNGVCMKCIQSKSTEPPLPSRPIIAQLNQLEQTRMCYTCRRVLPASAYCKGDIIKYVKCRECEAQRLREYRRKVKERPAPEGVVCHGCRQWIPGELVARTGKFARTICTPCSYKLKHHKKPHTAERINGRGPCTRCEMYGQSLNCMEPTATRKVKAPPNLGVVKAPKVKKLAFNVKKTEIKTIPEMEAAWKIFLSQNTINIK